MIQEQAARDALEVQRALDKILVRDATGDLSFLERLGEWLEELFSMRSPKPDGPAAWWEQVAGILTILAGLALVLLVIRYIMLKFRERYGPASKRAEQLVPVLQRVAALRLAARAARRQGDRQQALQKQFFALVLGLGERGDLYFRDAWTNRELLALGSPSLEVAAQLGPLLSELEPKEFGHEPVLASDLDRLEALAQHYFGPLEGELA